MKILWFQPDLSRCCVWQFAWVAYRATKQKYYVQENTEAVTEAITGSVFHVIRRFY